MGNPKKLKSLRAHSPGGELNEVLFCPQKYTIDISLAGEGLSRFPVHFPSDCVFHAYRARPVPTKSAPNQTENRR